MRALAILPIWLIAFSAHAFTPGTQAILAGPQVVSTMTQQGAAVDLNWQRGGYPAAGGRCATWGHLVPCYQLTSITRASVKYCSASDGLFFQVASGLPCIGSDNGYLIEEARTNSALWSRDQTQSGTWIAVGTGTALNAVGIDGTANSATTLTANGTVGSCTASCTILQTITLGSAADTYSVYLKRVTGTGTVNITINNLAGVTACTLTITSFTRCTVTATLANPVFGIQMTTVGDVVVADFNDLEAGSIPTSPILTTTVSATRATDNVKFSGAANLLLSVSAVWSILYNHNLTLATSTPRLVQDTGSNTPLFYNSTVQVASFKASGASTLAATVPSYATNAMKLGFANDASGRSIVGNNGTLTTDANGLPALSSGNIQIGAATGAGNSFLNTYTSRIVLNGSRLPDAALKALTQ